MELRLTDTNAADDAAGRVFGLDGNLYLPVVITGVVGIGLFAVLALWSGVSFAAAGIVAMLPVIAVGAWVLALRKGKPRGYDWDQVDVWLGAKHFIPGNGEGRA